MGADCFVHLHLIRQRKVDRPRLTNLVYLDINHGKLKTTESSLVFLDSRSHELLCQSLV